MSSDNFVPAELFPLSVHLQEELSIRGWTVDDVADHCSLKRERIVELVNDPDASILMKEAEQLGYTMGVSSQVFLNIQLAWVKRGAQKK